MLTHEEAAAMARLLCWFAFGGVVGYAVSWSLAFVVTRIARKREVRRMHEARKAQPE